MLPLPLRGALALTALLPALPRALAARAHGRQGAPEDRLRERWGEATQPRPEGRLLWVHAASVGEVMLVRDLARDLGVPVLVTTQTEGGRGAVPRDMLHQFAPVDTPAAVGRFLDHWRPDLGLVAEGDLWPRMVLEAGRRGIPLALVGARASRTRRRAPRSMAALLGRFALVTAQDGTVAAELRALGVEAAAVGDLRADANALPADAGALAALERDLGAAPRWAAVSTHEADEAAVIAAHRAARGARPGLRLVWLPRHPARAESVAAALEAAGIDAARRSLGQAGGEVLLFDTLGEAGLAFRVASLAFLGGSYGSEGGHNPYEPARLGCATLSGPSVANHRAAFDRLVAAGAARLVPAEALGRAVAELLGTTELDRMRAAARGAMAGSQGARERTLALLRPLVRAP